MRRDEKLAKTITHAVKSAAVLAGALTRLESIREVEKEGVTKEAENNATPRIRKCYFRIASCEKEMHCCYLLHWRGCSHDCAAFL